MSGCVERCGAVWGDMTWCGAVKGSAGRCGIVWGSVERWLGAVREMLSGIGCCGAMFGCLGRCRDKMGMYGTK